MGKHERLEIENAEKIVIDLLNCNQISEEQKKNKWINHCYELSKVISEDFGTIKKAEHIGNIYGGNEIGDIKIQTEINPNWIYLELKMSESAKSKGTLANISQNALTTSNLFLEGKNLSWSKFRDKNDFSRFVIDELNKYNRYSEEFNRGTINSQIKKKAAFLKKEFQDFLGLSRKTSISDKVCNYINTKSIEDVAQICCNIVKRARKDKISYLKYLSELEQNEENVKKFVIALLIGYHTERQLDHILSLPYNKIFDILDFYYVYYTNEKNGRIVVSKDNLGKEIKNIIESNINIIFPENQTNCMIQANGKNILRIVLHWKNKFQGIETPCLNIFKEF